MKSSTVYIPRFLIFIFMFTLGADYRLVVQPGEDVIVARGVTYRQVQLEGPLSLDVIEIDRTVSKAELVAWRSGGLKRTSEQVKDADSHYDRVLAALNADFFSFQTTWPIGYQVTDGEFVHATPTPRSHLLVMEDGRIAFDRPTFAGYVVAGLDTLSLHGVNRRRNGSHAAFYNAHAKDRVRSDSTGYVLHLRPIGGSRFVVRSKESGYGPLSVTEAFLSIGPSHPQASSWNSIGTGDTLKTWLGFSEPSYSSIKQVIGGGGMILEHGKAVTDLNESRDRVGANFMTARHPRTFVAVNQDQTKIWLCTVDGRQDSSIGMTFQDMADFLLTLGAWDALNLDGGGSTAMVVDGRVANQPSDLTGERAVANVLLLVEP